MMSVDLCWIGDNGGMDRWSVLAKEDRTHLATLCLETNVELGDVGPRLAALDLYDSATQPLLLRNQGYQCIPVFARY